MALKRIAALAAACLLSCAGPAFAEFKEPPPQHLREHIAALREADAVVGDEARCAAHPDLPGNRWREGAARGRCTLLREPKFPLDAIAAMLDSPGGVDSLEREFSALLEAHYSDQSQREQIFVSLAAFDESPQARAVSGRWLAAAPDSAFALVASATHYENLGWHARGAEVMSKVGADKQAAMSDALGTAAALHARALERNPRLSPACVGLMGIGRQMSAELEARVTPVCMEIDPDAYAVAWGMIRSAQPRWGGTPEALTYMVAYAAARVDRNPILGALLGEAAGDAVLQPPEGSKRPSEVVGPLAEVAKMAPSGTLIAQAGSGYFHRGEHWLALVHLSQGLRFWPLDDDWRTLRARVLMQLGDFEWAERDLDVALAIDDSDGWRHHHKAMIQRRAGRGHAAMRPHLQRALQDPDSREAAYIELCNGYLAQAALADAEECSRKLVSEYPTSGEGWFMREWLLTRHGGGDLQDARRKLLEHGNPDEARHAARLRELRAMEE